MKINGLQIGLIVVGIEVVLMISLGINYRKLFKLLPNSNIIIITYCLSFIIWICIYLFTVDFSAFYLFVLYAIISTYCIIIREIRSFLKDK